MKKMTDYLIGGYLSVELPPSEAVFCFGAMY